MEDLKEFIVELEKRDSKIANHFTNKGDLVAALKELDDVIGMRKIKSQIVKQIKTFVSSNISYADSTGI